MGEDPAALGIAVARLLKEKGADALLQSRN
jgi:hypothetical protein